MRWRVLWWFLPSEALPLILVGGAVLVILGLVRPGRLLVIVCGLALLPLLVPLIDAVFEALPLWITVPVLIAITLSFVRAMAALFIGGRASDHMVGALAADAIRVTLRLIFGLPFMIVRALVRLR